MKKKELKHWQRRELEEFCQQASDPEAMMKRLEKIWEQGFATKHLRIGAEYIIWARRMSIKVIPLEDAVFVYPNFGDTSFQTVLVIGYITGKELYVRVGKQEFQDARSFIRENFPHIEADYAPELRKLFRRKNVAEIEKYAKRRQQRIQDKLQSEKEFERQDVRYTLRTDKDAKELTSARMWDIPPALQRLRNKECSIVRLEVSPPLKRVVSIQVRRESLGRMLNLNFVGVEIQVEEPDGTISRYDGGMNFEEATELFRSFIEYQKVPDLTSWQDVTTKESR